MKKKIALKFTNVKDIELKDEDYQSDSDEHMDLMFQKFKKFLRHKK